MQLPAYFEILLTKADAGSIFDALMAAPIGTAPCYISLERLEGEDLLTVMANIQACLANTNNSAFIPYPIYIISPMVFDDISIKQFKSKNDLPPFFQIKTKRLNSKESQIQQMNELKVSRFKALYSAERMEELKSLSPLSRKLKLEAQKTVFYETLLEHLQKEK